MDGVLRLGWDELPNRVRRAVERECGPVLGAEPVGAGINSALAATLFLRDGMTFCKGMRSDDPAIRMHRHEARVNPWLPGCAPRLRWQIENDGWVLLGFDHVAGRPADLAPGSADVKPVTELLAALHSNVTTTSDTPLQRLSARWERLPAWRTFFANPPADLDGWALRNLELLMEWESAAPRVVDGETLLHTDLNSNNILISDQVHIVDWAWACRGAAWVDVAFLALRLMNAGHHPRDAEKWASTIPCWDTADESSVTAFAVSVAGLWEHRMRAAAPAPHRARLTAIAREWARFRLGN